LKNIIPIWILIACSLSLKTFAQGDLLIAPIRVIFEGNKQIEELSLVNIGKDTATFSITFVRRQMQEDGTFLMDQKFDSTALEASPYLRIFPRQVTLAPREPQLIMLQCRKKKGMAPGEYRSHLNFRSEKNYAGLGMNKIQKDTPHLNIEIIPIYGMSIPVIIREGEMNFHSELTDLRLEPERDQTTTLYMTLNRKGNCSAYGNIIVDYMPLKGKPIQVGKLKNIAVYTDIARRKISVRLTLVPGIIFKTGNLRVRYTSPDSSKYSIYSEVLAPIFGKPTGLVILDGTKNLTNIKTEKGQ